MLKLSLFVRLEAKPGKEKEVAAFLMQGLQLANQETTTPLWFALRWTRTPAAFVGLSLSGPLAWDGVLSFWVKNVAIGVWVVVMGVVLGQEVYRERAEIQRRGAELDGA